MAGFEGQSGRRVPIRRRVLAAVLVTTLTVLVIALITSVFFMNQMIKESESMLSQELQRNLSAQVEQKASKTDTLFQNYGKHLEFIRDYIHNMYGNRDEMIAQGTYFDTSRASTGINEYAMQSGFAHGGFDIEEYMDDIFFFSNLEPILEPIAKENEDLVATIYLGTTDGLLVSYDRWSYLSAVPEPDFLIYDYTEANWYTEGMQRDGIFLTGMYVDSMGRGLTVTMATPFKDQDGVVRGVLAADLYISGLYTEMISMNLGDGASSFAIDRRGNTISITSEEDVSAEEHTGLDSADIAKMTSGDTGILEKEDAFYAYTPVKSAEWTLCAIVPRTVLLEKVWILEESFRNAMAFFLLVAGLLVLAGVFFANRVTRSITHPIELLVGDMQVIAEGDLNHKATAYRNDEIGDMTGRLNEMVARLQATMHDLVSARDTAQKMHELANRDALTGLRNRAAYDTHLQLLEEGLAKGEDEFGIAVIDLNYLKRINDNHGHESGNSALRNLCALIREVFGDAPAFRIGGDEFVVILQGTAYENGESLIDAFNERVSRLSGDESLEPWERTSAAIGYARYDETVDANAEAVFVRADAIMYERKSEMKAIRE